jgi:hypothetical protein
MKKGTVQYHAWLLLRQAEQWAKDAKNKIREGNRIDALDSTRQVTTKIAQAQDVIQQTLPRWL